jgi:putative cardiolipin synthase
MQGSSTPFVVSAHLRLIVLALATLVSACGSLPELPAPKPSKAIALDPHSALGHLAQISTPDENLSGFRLLPLGYYSIDARLELARRAEKSLDVQYYYFNSDITGRTLLRALRDAAQRGVRVRLLLDDLYTGGNDELFLAFAAYDNVEVRLFNPFCCARDRGPTGRFLGSLGEWSRVNHRMHNKLFIADGAMAVIGGRNVADEYFLRGSSENFVDVDAFTIGFVLPPLEFLFDRYWNSQAVVPLGVVAHSKLDPQARRDLFERETAPAADAMPQTLPPNDILGYGPISDDLRFGRLGLIWGDARVFADHPDKPFDSQPGSVLAQTSVTYNLFEVIRTAQKEVVIESPYFVPGELSLQMLRELRSRQVPVTVMTNSLASTDEPAVFTGYSRHRQALLKMGVDLYELSSSRLQHNEREYLFGKSLGRLHAKVAVIDRRWVFVGSMNLDPRSATVNTELGALVDSPQLAKEMLRIIDIDRLQSAYRLRLTPTGSCCEWLGDDGAKETVLHEEPDSTAWMRTKAWLLSPFVPEEQL